MFTWVRGYRILTKITRRNEADLDWLVRKLEAKPPARVSGTAVFLSADVNAAPTSLMHNLKHNRVLHERNIVLSIRTEDVPRVPRHERVEVDRSNETFIKVIAHYGFMETPSIPKIFESCRRKDLNVDIGGTSFFLSRRSLRPHVQVGDAALAGEPLHLAGANRRGCDHILPDSDRPRRRGRHAGGDMMRRSVPGEHLARSRPS